MTSSPVRPLARVRRLALGAAAVAIFAAGCGEAEPAANPNEPEPTVASAAPTAEPSAEESASPEPTVEPADNLDGIEVSDGETPEVTISETPWTIDETRTEVLDEGDGTTVTAESTVEINYVGVNGRTGEVFDSSYEAGQSATFPLTQVITGFQKGLTDQKVGSRVLIAMPGTDGYDASGGSGDGTIQVGDTLVFVVDILDASLTGPEGEEQSAPEGMPTVDEADGAVTVEIPDSEPPTELETATLIEGEGKEVGESDQVTVSYVGYSWRTKEQIDSGQNEATTFDAVIQGWGEGLVGQTVGSRVELVIPPALAYPDGNPTAPTVEAGDTLVYVVDILYSQSPA